MEVIIIFTLYTSSFTGEARNNVYALKIEVSDEASLRQAVRHDYVAAEYAEGRRKKEGFLRSNCLMMDCDNDHSEQPNDWVTPDDVAASFPNVAFAVHYSRNHGKEKHGRCARPRFHVLFPIEEISQPGEYAELKQKVLTYFPFFDNQALDAARFFFGTPDPAVEIHRGELTLTSFLRQAVSAKSEVKQRLIYEGSRNSTLFHFALQVLKRYGKCERSEELFRKEAAKCVPALPEKEVQTIWKNGLGYLEKMQNQPGYVSPEDFDELKKTGYLKPGDYSDIGQAKILAENYREELLYTVITDYLRYNGSYWSESRQGGPRTMEEFLDLQLADAEDCMALAAEKLETMGFSSEEIRIGGKQIKERGGDAWLEMESALAYRKFVMRYRDMRYVCSTLQAAKPMLEVDLAELDRDGFLLNTPGQTYDLREGLNNPKEPRASDHITKQTLCSPGDQGAELWAKALDTFFCGDEELMEYVQQIVGLAAIGKIYQEALIIAYGEGRNGKSTFWNTVSRVLGTYSGTFSADALTVGCKRNVKPEMAELKGKRLVIAAELEEGMRLNTSMIKQLCSTDDISAEKKYKDPFHFTPTHTLVLYTNHLPKVTASDEGTWRRLIVIPFHARILPSEDVGNYSDYLMESAAPAIMKWIIEGAQKVISNHFHPELPACVREAIHRYRETNDWLSAFLQECCETGEEYREKSGDVYQEYRGYCMRTGEYPKRSQDFVAALELAGFTRKKTRQCNYINGLRLREGFRKEEEYA